MAAGLSMVTGLWKQASGSHVLSEDKFLESSNLNNSTKSSTGEILTSKRCLMAFWKPGGENFCRKMDCCLG